MKKLLALMVSAFVMTSAYAETVTFSGNLNETCSIFVNYHATLDFDNNRFDQITTDNGQAADVHFYVSNDGVFKGQVDEITAFTASPTLTAPMAFNTSAYIYGGPQVGNQFPFNVDKYELNLDSGNHLVYVGLTVWNTDMSNFPTGYYEANTDVACVAR